MKPVQIGTFFYKTDATAEIYEKYPDFFSVDDNEWLVKYTVSKDPSKELIADIESYYAKIKAANRKHDEFVDEVAKEVLSKLSQEDKDYIFLHPDSNEHHFGLGLYIRNNYIHGKKLDFGVLDPDNLSSDITARIASLLIDNYDYENKYYRYLYNSSSFNCLRRLYFVIKRTFPDELISEYEDLPDDYEAVNEAMIKIGKVVFDIERFQEFSKKYGLTDKQYSKYKSLIDDYNIEHNAVPYDIALLACRHLDIEYRQQLLELMKVVLEITPRISLEFPSFVFNQKDSVLLAVSTIGSALKRFPRFNSDGDIIRTALKANGEAIQYVNKDLRDNPEYVYLALSNPYSNALKKRCMAKYRDKEEYVKIALEANGCNIEYASDRLKDDFELAKFAITHQRNWYPENTVCNLSKRLRDNLEIALLDIREGHACVDSYSKRLRDNDEVAKALIASGNRWKLYQMSRRIQEKYENED